jgi:hypothetical protein
VLNGAVVVVVDVVGVVPVVLVLLLRGASDAPPPELPP